VNVLEEVTAALATFGDAVRDRTPRMFGTTVNDAAPLPSVVNSTRRTLPSPSVMVAMYAVEAVRLVALTVTGRWVPPVVVANEIGMWSS
jgi:hypothetical protein